MTYSRQVQTCCKTGLRQDPATRLQVRRILGGVGCLAMTPMRHVRRSGFAYAFNLPVGIRKRLRQILFVWHSLTYRSAWHLSASRPQPQRLTKRDGLDCPSRTRDDRTQNGLTTSPPLIVFNASNTCGSIFSEMNRTDPSAMAMLAPPGEGPPMPSGPLM